MSCNTEPDGDLRQGRVAAATQGKILFVQNGDIFICQNGRIETFLKLGNAAWPRWSPDGSQIVFVRLGDAYSDLYLASTDTRMLRQLTRNQPTSTPGSYAYVQNAVWALSPTWSPDGSLIAYISDLNTLKNFLWLIPAIGGAPQRVEATTRLGDNVDQPSFSPDGTRIVFVHRAMREDGLQHRTDLWIVNLRTGELRPLLQGGDGQYAPSWSPDGQWIAFIGRHNGANDLFVISPEGGEPFQLTTSGTVSSPTWSPDGQMLAYLQLDDDGFSVYVMSFGTDADRRPVKGKPRKLFTASDIDAVSGLSWAR